MSNPKNAIGQIKNLMKQYGFLNDEPVLKSFKLENNTILEAIELKKGNKITKVSDEFERVALEDGTFRLVENFEIKVKDGSIVSVKEIFIDAKLVDGTVVKVEGEELLEGAAVKVVTEDAEIPAPDGVHELESGVKVETKDGIIVKIEEPISEEMEDVEVPVEVPAEVAPVAQEVVEAIVEALVPLMDEVKVLVEEMKKMKDGMKEIKKDFNAFKKEPAGKKISDGKTDFNKEEQSNSVDARIASIMSMRRK
jgi:hypothetical protein